MEYRRRRVSGRRPPEKDSGGVLRALALLIVFGAAIYLIIGTGVGKKLKEIGGAKLYESCAAIHIAPEPTAVSDTAAAKTSLPAPESTPAGASARVSLPPIDICMIQMGIFDSAESCAEAAEAIKALGAAGYVYDDNGSYRLIAAAYSDTASAENVKEQIEATGRQCSIFTRSYDGAELLVTAPEERLEPIRRAFEQAYSVVSQLDALCLDFDSEMRSVEYGIGALNDIRTQVRETSEGIGGLSPSGKMMERISRYYADLLTMICDCASASDERIAFSSAVKELRIKAAVRYSALLAEIGE